MFRFLLLAALLTGLASPLFAQESELQTRFFQPPAHLLGYTREVRSDLTPPLRQSYEPREGVGVADPILEFELLADIIRELTGPDEWDRDGARLNIVNRQIVAVNNSEILDRIPPIMAAVERAASQPCRVKVFRLNETSPPGRRSRGEAADLAKKGTLVSDLKVLGGRPKEFGLGKRVPFLGTCNVEVSQGATVSAPRMNDVVVGVRGTVEAHRTPSGRIILRTFLRDTEVVEIKKVKSAVVGTGSLEMPVVDSATLVSAAELESGAGMVVRVKRAAREASYLFQVIEEGAEASLGLENVHLLSAGAAGMEGTNYGSLLLDGPIQGDEGVVFLESESPALLEQDWLIEMTKTAVDPNWHDGERNRLSTHDCFVFLKHDGGKADAAKEFIENYHAHIIRNVDIELRLVKIGGDGKASAVWLAEQTSATMASLGISTLTGDRYRSVIGRESAELRDYRVEIAQEATNAAPVPSTRFDGMATQVEARLGSQGRILLTGEVVWRGSDAQDRVIEFEIGSKEWNHSISARPKSTLRTGFSLNGVYSSDTWHVVGVQSDLALLVKVTK